MASRAGSVPERLLDLVVEEAVHRLFFRVRHLVGDEPLDERAVALGIHRRVEPHVAGVERGERLHDIDREPGEVRELLGVGLAPQLLAQNLGRLDDAREIGRAVQRDAHRSALGGRATRESPGGSTTRRTEMNLTPWSGSNLRAAVSSPTLPSPIRSMSGRPRF